MCLQILLLLYLQRVIMFVSRLTQTDNPNWLFSIDILAFPSIILYLHNLYLLTYINECWDHHYEGSTNKELSRHKQQNMLLEDQGWKGVGYITMLDTL